MNSGYYPPRKQYGFWVWPGFVKSIKSDLIYLNNKTELPRSFYPKDGKQTHDKWTCMIANAIGGVVVLKRPAALYRRHAAALTNSEVPQGIKERIKKSIAVSNSDYLLLSDIAGETAEYLTYLSCVAKDNHTDPLRVSAHMFQKISRIFCIRAKLYSEKIIYKKLLYFARIALLGGYAGPPMISFGWRSAAKDISQALSLIDLFRNVRGNVK